MTSEFLKTLQEAREEVASWPAYKKGGSLKEGPDPLTFWLDYISGDLNLEETLKDQTAFSEWLSKKYYDSKMTKKQLAEALDVSIPSVSRWIKGTIEPSAFLKKRIYEWFESQVF